MGWSKATRISVMLVIDIAFFLVELISGFLVHSLALMADAFHMLNDIISLLVGLWAVNVARKATTDRYSYGWLRAEILGAFFNAVFLIALCVSIILEAITRFIDPPVIDNPKVILIVGCCGLASNLAGFVVLGGHGHSHGSDEHAEGDEHGHEHIHDHNEAAVVEEGRATGDALPYPTEEGPAMDVLPYVAVARARTGSEVRSSENRRHIQFDGPEDRIRTVPLERCGSQSSSQRGRERRRASSLRHGRLQSIEDVNFYPASFRQNIIERSKSNANEADGSSVEEGSSGNDESAVDENTPLIVQNGNGATYKTGDTAAGGDRPRRRSTSLWSRSRRDSVHKEHHHNKSTKSPKKGSGGHGHNHADMGMNAMVLHVLGDALGNVGVIVTALIIWLTTWSWRYYADPAVSLLITVIILRSALPLTKATSKVLLQATPDQIDIQEIKEDIQALPGVVSCHHVHVWQLSDTKIVASMHVQVAFPITEEGGEKYMALAKQARKCLHAYGIHSATIQPEFCLDKRCNHLEEAGLTMDGHVTPRPGNGQTYTCLLECVDDCVGQGCCSTASHKDDSSRRSSHSAHSPGHDHEEHHGH